MSRKVNDRAPRCADRRTIYYRGVRYVVRACLCPACVVAPDPAADRLQEALEEHAQPYDESY